MMHWRALPPEHVWSKPVQWVGDEDGQDIAWITEGRMWGEPGHRWLVATPHGTAAGCRATLEDAQRSVEALLIEHADRNRRKKQPS